MVVRMDGNFFKIEEGIHSRKLHSVRKEVDDPSPSPMKLGNQ
jgi:hypothetical protein